MTTEKSPSSLLMIMVSNECWNSVSDYGVQSRNKEGCAKKNPGEHFHK